MSHVGYVVPAFSLCASTALSLCKKYNFLHGETFSIAPFGQCNFYKPPLNSPTKCTTMSLSKLSPNDGACGIPQNTNMKQKSMQPMST